MPNPEQFFHDQNPNLHKNPEVEHELERRKLKKLHGESEEELSQKPKDKISNFLSVLEKTHLSHRDDPRVLRRIKDYYHKKHTIKEENIPNSYYENQKRLARERGHGDIEITDEMKSQLSEVITKDQETTLDTWINYFTSPDTDTYPMWFKYWSWNNMLKLSTFDKEKHEFGKRDKGTVAPFPDLNREALAYVYDEVRKEIDRKYSGKKKEEIKKERDESVSDPELKEILLNLSFSKLYTYAIEKVTPTEQNELEITEGKWVKYDRGSDHMPLVTSLQGHGTGWCTAGEETARHQLETGDFYVYYSNDKNGSPRIPRVAIRMEHNSIAEVRGIAPDQNMDGFIIPVAEEKLKEFPDGEKYKKKSADMERLTQIEKDVKSGGTLTDEDLRFLYEIDSPIEGFGYEKDPRIEEILENRDNRDDLSKLLNCRPDQISLSEEEALNGDIVYHHGNIHSSSIESAEGLTLPQSIGGDLYLRSLMSAEGLILPQSIGGTLYLSSLTSAEGLTLPQSISGTLYLSSLTSAEGLTLPQSIGGDLNLVSLTSAEGLEFSKTLKCTVYLSESLYNSSVDILHEEYPEIDFRW